MTARQTGQPKPDPADAPELPARDRTRAYYDPSANRLVTPFEIVQWRIDGIPAFRAMHAGVELDVFEQLAARPMTGPELVEECQASPEPFMRLLACLHADGYLSVREGYYQLTDLGRVLTAAAQPSQRDAVLVTGSAYWEEAMQRLPEVIASGRPPSPNGLSLYDYLKLRPRMAAHFNDFMLSRSHEVGPELAHKIDFADVRTVCDVGGGLGQVLSDILDEHEHLNGFLLELPEVAEKAHNYVEWRGLNHRVKIIAGDMYGGLPEADVYVVSSVLHNLGGTDYLRLVLAIMEAMPDDGGRLLIVEGMLPDKPGTWSAWHYTNMRMMAMFPEGCVRTVAHHTQLLAEAGYKVASRRTLVNGQTLLVAVPRPSPERA